MHCAENQDKTDPDSSFQSNASERHPKGKRKRTAYVDVFGRACPQASSQCAPQLG